MKGIVVYGSKYGTTERYARELADCLQLEVADYQDLQSLPETYDVLIYGGGIYAGKITGLKELLKKFPAIPAEKLLVFSVGLRNPQSEENISEIRQGVKAQFESAGLPFLEEQLFLLRGGMELKKLSFPHRMMMKLLSKHPEEIMPEEKDNQELKEQLKNKVDFVDFASLKPIQEKARQIAGEI